MDKNMPEKVFKVGCITATVWENKRVKDNKEFSFRTVSLGRSYMDRDGAWKNTSALRINDLPKASIALNQAYEYTLFDEKK